MEDMHQKEESEELNDIFNNIDENSNTPFLDLFSKDLIKNSNDLSSVVGREDEINELERVLNKKKKSNAILMGKAGVGKTAIIEGLAKRIAEGNVNRKLINKKIFQLDLTSVVSGTKFRGEFEERMNKIIEDIISNPEIIIFIDEIHNIIEAGNSMGSIDASNILKPYLSDGSIKCIGTTTYEDYKKKIENDNAFKRRFQSINVKEPTKKETEKILSDISSFYEDAHNVKFNKEILREIIDLSERYITSNNFPDKAIDVLDEIGSYKDKNVDLPENIKDIKEKMIEASRKKRENAEKQNYKRAAEERDKERDLKEELNIEYKKWEDEIKNKKSKISKNDVYNVISKMTGIPVDSVRKGGQERIKKVEKTLRDNIIGQDDAVDKVMDALKMSAADLSDKNRPISSFLFVGPTGVGKTEIAKLLAKSFFDGEENFIRFDMSEMQDKHSSSKLIGTTSGYVGYEEGGQLTEKVKNNPYSLVLLDEIEKADMNVIQLFLQILDDGYIQDGKGNDVDFRNTIIVMTSNVGNDVISNSKKINISNKDLTDHYKKQLQKEMSEQFSPEFLNRIDESVFFNELKEEDIKKIIDIHLSELLNSKTKYDVFVKDEVKQKIYEHGYSKEYGARSILRYIREYVKKPLAREISKSKTKKGSISVGWDHENEEAITERN